MNLSTTYLGFELPHPLMPGASPLADDLDTVRRLEDAGAAAIVHALAVRGADRAASSSRPSSTPSAHGESFAEALCYFPEPDDVRARARTSTSSRSAASRRPSRVPVIALAQRHDAGRLARATRG